MTDDESPPTTLREDLELLHSIVQDIAKMTPKLKSITNMMVHEAMRKSLADMMVQQNQLVTAIVERSNDSAAKQRFRQTRERMDQLEADVQAGTDVDAIKELGSEIERLSEDYSQQFQDIVKGIVDSGKGQPQPT